jgi:hypothetical protein
MKMKKMMIFVLGSILILTLALAGCGGGDTKDKTTDGEKGKKVEDASFGFSYNGKRIVPGMDMKDVLAITGEAKDIFEAPSCAFNGVDRIYYFAGFELNSWPDGDTERLLSVVLKDDSVETDEGLYLGATKEDAQAIYGAGKENDLGTEISWTEGDLKLRVVFEGNIASGIGIDYTPAQEIVDEHVLEQ